jgi:hypothetical protein
MFALTLQIVWGEEHLKKSLISTLDKVICYKGKHFQESAKPHFKNRLEIS